MKPAVKTKKRAFCPNNICLPNGIHIQLLKNPDGSITKESAALMKAAMKIPKSEVSSFRTMERARPLSRLVPTKQAEHKRTAYPT